MPSSVQLSLIGIYRATTRRSGTVVNSSSFGSTFFFFCCVTSGTMNIDHNFKISNLQTVRKVFLLGLTAVIVNFRV